MHFSLAEDSFLDRLLGSGLCCRSEAPFASKPEGPDRRFHSSAGQKALTVHSRLSLFPGVVWRSKNHGPTHQTNNKAVTLCMTPSPFIHHHCEEFSVLVADLGGNVVILL